MQCLVTELYFCRLATVARLNGHTIAGGCLLAMACDYRVMKRGAKIGLNEAALGMTLPWYGTRQARIGPFTSCAL